ncbi:MAG: hypothetical protein R2708_08745 [Vicinamibacterales bacterium]
MAKARTRRASSTRGSAGFVSGEFEVSKARDYVVAELRYESPVAYSASGFRAAAGARDQSSKLNEVLERFDIASIGSQFGMKAADVRDRMDLAAALPAEPSARALASHGAGTEFRQSGFVQIVPKRSADAKKIAEALNRQGAIWKAYVAPRPVPAFLSGSASGSRLFEPTQGYLYSPPFGIGAADVWPLAGAKGRGVTICDIEGAWNLRHGPPGIEADRRL